MTEYIETPKITDEEIAVIKRAKAGDESAFTWIFNRYKPFVDELLCSYMGDKDEARDLTNVVFLKVHKNLDKFSSFDSFGGWLRVITNHTAIDYLRTKSNHRYVFGIEDSEVPEPPEYERTENETVNHLTVKRIFEVLDRYHPNVRRVFDLYYRKGMTVEMVASKLHIPTGTVKSILSRTRKKLKKKVNLRKP